MLKTVVNKFRAGVSVSALYFRRVAYPVAIAIGVYPASMYSAPNNAGGPPGPSNDSVDDYPYFSFKRPSLIVEGSIGASMMLLGGFKSGTLVGPNLGLMLATDNLIYDSTAFKMGFGMSLNGVYFRPSLVDKAKDATNKATKMKVKIDDKEKSFDCFDILKFPAIELSLSPMLIANAYINKTTYATLGIGPKFSYTKGIAAVKSSNIIKQTPRELALSSQAGKTLDAGKYKDYGIFASGTIIHDESQFRDDDERTEKGKSRPKAIPKTITFDIATKKPGKISGGKVHFKDAFGMIESAPISGKGSRVGKLFDAIREELGELPDDEGVYHELSAGARLDLGMVFAQTKALKLGLKLSYEADMPFYYRSNVKPFFTNTRGKIWLVKPNLGGISSAALNKVPAVIFEADLAIRAKTPISQHHIMSNDYTDFFYNGESKKAKATDPIDAPADHDLLLLKLKNGKAVPVTFKRESKQVYNCSLKTCKDKVLERNYPSMMFNNTADVNAVLEDGYWLKRGAPSFVVDDNISDDDLKKMMKIVNERKEIQKAINKVYPFKNIGHKLTASITIGLKL